MSRYSAHESIVEGRELLNSARSLAVFTGSGVSQESGIPTFRGSDGLWKNYDAMQLATPWAFEKNPKLVWEWYNWRRGIMKSAKPNAGHYAIAKMETLKDDFLLITQNIDGLHERAGSRKFVELHGNIWRVRCTSCRYIESDDRDEVPYPPICPSCGSILRPDVVWFGEALDQQLLGMGFDFARRCDLLICVGTSNVVFPAAQIPLIALSSGAKVIEVNIEETPLTGSVTLFLKGKGGEILPQLL